MGKTREAGELLSNNLLTGDHSAETINVGTAITFYGGTTLDTASINGGSPYQISSRISWSESQA